MSPVTPKLGSEVVVLKFGSSVLRAAADLDHAVLEIDRHLRRAKRVVAVVSAFGDTTDGLLRLAASKLDATDQAAKAELLAGGEHHAVSLLNIELARAGIDAVALDAMRLGIRASGDRLDAEPTGIDPTFLDRSLREHAVVVVPGFLARHEDGGLALLGRGGSDLSALFLAAALNADCRLVKDVPGLFEHDPKAAGPPPRRFTELSFADAAGLDGRILQAKALRFAADRRFPFRVICCADRRHTLVGAKTTTKAASGLQATPPLRVGLLGAGTVGHAVARRLLALGSSSPLELVAVLVRETGRRREGIPAQLITADQEHWWRAAPQVVVDLTGDHEAITPLLERAEAAGCAVVSADKSWPLQQPDDPASRRYGASIGGALPGLEAVRCLARDEQIEEINAVLNGSSNFILDLLAQGRPLDEAVREAQRLGFTEADPAVELDGLDASRKLALLARAAWGVELDPHGIPCRGLREVPASFLRGPGRRLLARALRHVDGTVETKVEVVQLQGPGLFLDLNGVWNGIEIRCRSGHTFRLRGKGAGGWPTSTAVIGDLLEIHRDRRWLKRTAAVGAGA